MQPPMFCLDPCASWPVLLHPHGAQTVLSHTGHTSSAQYLWPVASAHPVGPHTSRTPCLHGRLVLTASLAFQQGSQQAA